ncbi:MAG: sugar transferase [Planctomycetes bacterium]|nr:sugar transferase [Planctomycetota bacterium]
MILTLGTASAAPHSRFMALKNVTDRLLAAVGLIILMPLLALLCLVIKMTSRGPVFFQQERVGQNGRPFNILKLRTMVQNAESATGPVWAQDNDPRVTTFGRLLRLSHLDEIPQLINVLAGNMSLVGPRPERPVFVEQFKRQIPDYADRLKVKPGITGLAQVYHSYDSTLRDVRKKLAYDLLYIKKMCMMTDIIIIFLTVRCLTGRGAK